jgi:hypothetical protein
MYFLSINCINYAMRQGLPCDLELGLHRDLHPV